MRFEEWEPLYAEIIRDMGYDRSMDEYAALVLSGIISDLAPSRRASITKLRELINGKDVLVCGNAPGLKKDMDMDYPYDCIIAADGAAAVILNIGIVPHIIVTDLDGDVEAEIECSQKGAVMVVHAHGDNIPALRSVVPRLYNLIGSTQAGPLTNVYNFGGFTDGDRCVFLAYEFGASSISYAGFDFGDSAVTQIKKKKLKWARRLIDIAQKT